MQSDITPDSVAEAIAWYESKRAGEYGYQAVSTLPTEDKLYYLRWLFAVLRDMGFVSKKDQLKFLNQVFSEGIKSRGDVRVSQIKALATARVVFIDIDWVKLFNETFLELGEL